MDMQFIEAYNQVSVIIGTNWEILGLLGFLQWYFVAKFNLTVIITKVTMLCILSIVSEKTGGSEIMESRIMVLYFFRAFVGEFLLYFLWKGVAVFNLYY